MAKIKGIRKLTKKQKELKKLIPDVKKEFKKKGPKNIRTQIVADILRGVSPVNGKGKFKKYSDSYKEQIQGKAAYLTIGGKVVRIGTELRKPEERKAGKGRGRTRLEALRNRSANLKAAKKANREARKAAKNNREARQKLVKKLTSQYALKKISPVNMKVSKGMLNKLYVKVPIFRRGLKLVIGIKHKLADIHNRLGAAGKTVRRLLPTKNGENFNRKITKRIQKELEKSIKKVVNRLNRK